MDRFSITFTGEPEMYEYVLNFVEYWGKEVEWKLITKNESND